ncbi:MAG: nucleotide exchange factor GrpE [Actinomycetes bacterium]
MTAEDGAAGEAASVEEEAVADLAAAAEVVEGDLATLSAERDEMRATAQRIQADFENFRKRAQRDVALAGDAALARFVEQLLPVLDAFEGALVAVAGADEPVRKGVELAVAEFLAVLGRNGFERIDALGAPFDPEQHEAVLHEETGEHDGPVVVEVLRTGYRTEERIIRPAMVRVAQ